MPWPVWPSGLVSPALDPVTQHQYQHLPSRTPAVVAALAHSALRCPSPSNSRRQKNFGRRHSHYTHASLSLGRPAGLCPLTQTPGTFHAATGCLLKQQIPHLHRQSPPLRIPSRLVASSRPLFANLPSDDTHTHTLRETKTPALTSPTFSNRSIHHSNVIQPKATNPQPHSAAFGSNLALRILRLIWAWTSVIL